VICERAILRCPPRPPMFAESYRVSSPIASLCAMKVSRREEGSTRIGLPSIARRGNTPWPFYGIRCTSSRNPDLVSKDGSHGRITESAKRPRPTDQTESELSIKMFTQPRLRRFLSRDKVHNFDVSYKPRCYLSPSEECTFRICLKSIYQPI